MSTHMFMHRTVEKIGVEEQIEIRKFEFLATRNLINKTLQQDTRNSISLLMINIIHSSITKDMILTIPSPLTRA